MKSEDVKNVIIIVSIGLSTIIFALVGIGGHYFGVW